jgi:hypothetical protein
MKMTDETFLKSWNEINKQCGLPPIVELGPEIIYEVEKITSASTEATASVASGETAFEAAPATATNPKSD